MSDTIIIIRMWCEACDDFTWHIMVKGGQYQCLPCWSKALEDVLKDTFVINAQ